MHLYIYPRSLESMRGGNDHMLAGQLTAPGRFEIRGLPRPEPAAGEVLVRLEGCGMCSSTLPKWQGRDWFTYPLPPGDPGHEGYGTVAALGDGVEDLAVGDRVSMLSYHALAEYDVAPAGQVVKLPDALRHAVFPGEPIACAYNVIDRSDLQPGQTVAIIGIGFLGALLVQLAKQAGARVIALARRPFSLELARDCGADHTVLMDDHWRVIEAVKNLTDGRFCERVIEATGAQWPLDLAAELTAVRGRLLISGYHQDGPRQVNMQLWNWRGLDVINAHERDPARYIDGMRRAAEAAAGCELNYVPLLTHYFFPDQLGEAFRYLEERPDGFVKGIVRF